MWLVLAKLFLTGKHKGSLGRRVDLYGGYLSEREARPFEEETNQEKGES